MFDHLLDTQHRARHWMGKHRRHSSLLELMVWLEREGLTIKCTINYSIKLWYGPKGVEGGRTICLGTPRGRDISVELWRIYPGKEESRTEFLAHSGYKGGCCRGGNWRVRQGPDHVGPRIPFSVRSVWLQCEEGIGEREEWSGGTVRRLLL